VVGVTVISGVVPPVQTSVCVKQGSETTLVHPKHGYECGRQWLRLAQTVIVVCVAHGYVIAIVQPRHGLVMCVQPHATPQEFGMQVAVDWNAAGFAATPHEFGMHVAVDWNASGAIPHEFGTQVAVD